MYIAITEVWVLVYWPEEDSTTVVAIDHLLDGEGCEVGSNCVNTGKVVALGTYIVYVTVVNIIMCT